MSDESVSTALRSDDPLVIVDAPAGCGKTYQAAAYAQYLARTNPEKRLLILTHTHAACSEFAARTKGLGAGVDIRTIDGLIAGIAGAYHQGLGLPANVPAWARQHSFEEVAVKVRNLLTRYPAIAAALADRYSVIICDEHQDASGDQHAVVNALHGRGSRLRIFADPMQRIFHEDPIDGAQPPIDWDVFCASAHRTESLNHPHRWTAGCGELGEWTLEARRVLKDGGAIDLRGPLPSGLSVAFIKNISPRHMGFQLSREEAKRIYEFEKVDGSLLILTRHNKTAGAFRGFFDRRIPLWEGHRRAASEDLVDVLTTSPGDSAALGDAVARFLAATCKGLSDSAFGRIFKEELNDGCSRSRRGKPGLIQRLARVLLEEPDHRGVARLLRDLSELLRSEAAFRDVAIDHSSEYWEVVRLGDFSDPATGYSEITHRRTYSRPKPKPKSVSTIHKAKGLEVDNVAVIPCSSKTFPDRPDARCLLYVAVSRPINRLLLVIARDDPSPLLIH